MLNLTLEAEGEKIPIRVRTGWHEVSTAHYAKVFDLEGEELLAAMLEVDLELIQDLPQAQKLQLAELLSWAGAETPTEARPKKLPGNFGWNTIGQIEQAREALKKYGVWGGAPYVYSMFMYPFQRRFTDPHYKWSQSECLAYAEKVKSMPISEIYGPYLHFIKELETFVKRFQHLLKTEPDELEEQAGVQRFAKYGFFATLWHRCGGDPTRFDEMIQVPGDVFYTALAMGTEVEEYQQAVNEIRQRINRFE